MWEGIRVDALLFRCGPWPGLLANAVGTETGGADLSAHAAVVGIVLDIDLAAVGGVVIAVGVALQAAGERAGAVGAECVSVRNGTGMTARAAVGGIVDGIDAAGPVGAVGVPRDALIGTVAIDAARDGVGDPSGWAIRVIETLHAAPVAIADSSATDAGRSGGQEGMRRNTVGADRIDAWVAESALPSIRADCLGALRGLAHGLR